MWSEYIKKLRTEFVDKKVMYEGKIYRIACVDYNGIVHIDKPSEHNDTTAVYDPYEARKYLVAN